MTPDETFAQMVAEGDGVLERLDDCARTVPDKVFIHYGEDGIKLTFAEFKRRTDRIAAGLAAMGVTEGVAVSVLTRNSLLSALAMSCACAYLMGMTSESQSIGTITSICLINSSMRFTFDE